VAEESNPFDHPSSSIIRSVTSAHDSEAQPQYEFVKRSEWPDRETAAIRRDKSSATLERVRPKDNISVSPSTVVRNHSDSRQRKDRSLSVRDNVINDLLQWRQEVFADSSAGRGRPRQRVPYEGDSSVKNLVKDLQSRHTPVDKLDSSSVTSSRSRQYPPSPSPSRSPEPRLLPTSPKHQRRHHHKHHVPSSATSQHPSLISSRQPPPQAPHATSCFIPGPELSDVSSLPSSERSCLTPEDDGFSSWDDDAASISSISPSTASTPSVQPFSPFRGTSLSPPPIVRHYVHHDYAEDDIEDDIEDGGLLTSSSFRQSADQPPDIGALNRYLHRLPETAIHEDDGASMKDAFGTGSIRSSMNNSQESLPHIPLRPFRNQVGGHNAIYKFTKRAVCKVR
jgi:inositol-hexakisphosphate 5-kinase